MVYIKWNITVKITLWCYKSPHAADEASSPLLEGAVSVHKITGPVFFKERSTCHYVKVILMPRFKGLI